MKPLIFFLSALLLAVHAQAYEAPNRQPGYVDFDSLGMAGEPETTVEIYLKGPLLLLISEATRHEDPELADLLSKLKLIRVQTYALKNRDAREAETKAAETVSRLERAGWETVVRVREKKERVTISMKMNAEEIQGLFVTVVEPGDEAVFINIVGDIDPAQIGRIGRKFNISPLESLGGKKKP